MKSMSCFFLACIMMIAFGDNTLSQQTEYRRMSDVFGGVLYDYEERFREFNLSDEQLKIYRIVADKEQRILRDSHLMGISGDARRKMLIDAYKEFYDTLTPEQKKVLEAEANIMNVIVKSNLGFDDKYVAQMLGLTDEQKDKVKKLIAQHEDEFQEELTKYQGKRLKIMRKHLNKALEHLKPEQRANYLDKFWPKNELDKSINPKKFLHDD